MSGIDILSLDQVAAAETPFEFEVKDASGQPIGLFLSILGNDAEVVEKFTLRKANEQRRKPLEVVPIEDDIAFSIEACVVRTVGWRGAQQEFSQDLAHTLYSRNKHIRAQVLKESAKAGNFMQSRSSS